MIRLLILASLFILIALLYQKIRPQLGSNKKPSPNNPKTGKPMEEKINKCQTCGLHVPQSSGVEYQDKFFCSEAHKLTFIENHSKESS